MIASLSIIALATSFIAGVVSFLSPCVLPLVPGYVAYVSGRSLDPSGDADVRQRFAALPLSALFVLGFTTVFVTLGASATAAGQLLLSYRSEAGLLAGGIVILFGLLMIGLVRWSWLQRDLRFHFDLPRAHPVAAYVLGLAFALGWTPCIGPVLGAILTTSASSATVSQGVTLLAVYSLGLGLPFLAVAVSTERLVGGLRRLGRLGRSLQIGAGAVMVAMGIAMITGQLDVFSYWLLGTFPVLAQIG
jgi:cytochrome c-type biogenesis protein